MMNTKMLILSLSLLAQKPMVIPSLMSETYIHPSVQAFGLDNKETARVSSPVDFIGIVEKMEPDMVPPSSTPIMDILQSTKSLAKQVKTAVSVAAKEFYYEVCDAKIVFVNDKTQTFVNNLVADVLVATAPFRFGTAELLDEMTSSVVQFINECQAAAQGDLLDALVFLGKKSQTFVKNVVADVLVASAPFRFGTTELLGEMTSSVVQFINEFQDAIVSKYQLVNENFETFVGQLPSRALQCSGIQSAARSMIQKILDKNQLAYNEFQSSIMMALSIPSVVDADSTFIVVCQQAYAKLESFLIPAPEPEPTSLESIARDALDRLVLEYQRVNERVASLCHHLFTPATPPPPSTPWVLVQRISTTAYEKLETFVKDLFAPSPPPSRTIQSMVFKDGLKTVLEGYEQYYEKLKKNYITRFLAPPASPPLPRSLGLSTMMNRFHVVLYQYERAYTKMETIYRRLPRFIFSMNLMLLPKLRCDLVLEESSLLEYHDWMKFEERLAYGRPSE